MKKRHRPTNPMYDSSLEEDFHRLWLRSTNIPIVPHHTVDCWELDFAFPRSKVGIELQGYGTGHLSYKGMQRDTEKHNYLVMHDWTVLYFMSVHLKEPGQMLYLIVEVLKKKGLQIAREHRQEDSSSKPNGGPKPNPLIEAARRLRNKGLDRT